MPDVSRGPGKLVLIGHREVYGLSTLLAVRLEGDPPPPQPVESPSPAPDTTAPPATQPPPDERPSEAHAVRLSSLKLSPATFRAARRGGSVRAAGRRRPPIGTRISFALDQAAPVKFRVDRRRPGRRVRGRCVAPTKRNAKAKRCKRYVRLRGSFTVDAVAGSNRFHFTGRLRKRALKPGRYVLVAKPRGGARATRVKFRIVR